ncbi:NADPH:quinone reductase [Lentilactobacillus fungorum]|uniref:NADPH:quinone reductase n=1 Tax=Lentilactobacillus fungorum TaxID=2201250 RepID=A0ABQ3VZI4_9LACO|nr:zinc-binding dehydrogenase [Lentilactobacillus fungorum]GHP13309.1 NADPH:quinone reductase [Lentilactobacillus fungorum]
MKAIIQRSYNGNDDLIIDNLATPKVAPMSALVRTQYTPVLPYDWLTEEGKLIGMRPTQLPMVISYGFVGVVEQVGMLRNHRLVGKPVIGAQMTGAAAEFINSQIPPLLFEIPQSVNLADAATLIGGADAAQLAVNDIKATKNEVILITGASGGVGTYLIQLLKHEHVTVIALANRHNVSFLRELGADYVVDYNDDLAKQLADVPRATKVIDTVGTTALLDQLSGYYDELAIFSLSRPTYTPQKPVQTFRFGNGNIGIAGYHKLISLLAAGEISGVVQQTFDFEVVKQAQHVSKEQHARGRILLKYH